MASSKDILVSDYKTHMQTINFGSSLRGNGGRGIMNFEGDIPSWICLLGVKFNWRDQIIVFEVRVDLGEWGSELIVIFTVKKKNT